MCATFVQEQRRFLEKIDALLAGVPWKLETLQLRGDITDLDGKAHTKDLELWYHDLVECIRDCWKISHFER